MAESIAITTGAERSTIYAELLPQIEALIGAETDVVANLANVAAVLNQAFRFLWVGFYLAKDGELVLGPFQGPLACTRIKFDQGVCGHAYTLRKTVVVPDVEKFPGHIACASESRSEIVVPLFSPGGEVFGVLDIDSDKLDYFNVEDVVGLERIVRSVETIIPAS